VASEGEKDEVLTHFPDPRMHMLTQYFFALLGRK
jgi:hypothetical protein